MGLTETAGSPKYQQVFRHPAFSRFGRKNPAPDAFGKEIHAEARESSPST
jgi:hypothetical protein